MIGARPRTLFRVALAAVVMAGLIPTAAAPARAAGPVAEFDWAMPDRLGLDENGNGVIDVNTSSSFVSPDGWQVNFDACMSTPSTGALLRRFTWHVDQVLIGDPDAQASPCGGFTYYFPYEGEFEIALEVEDTTGATAHLVRTIAVQDFLVVAMGDSMGSGQGNPDIPIPGDRFGDVERLLTRLGDALVELATVESDYDRTSRRIDEARNALRNLALALQHQLDVCTIGLSTYDFDACAGEALVAVGDAFTALFEAAALLGRDVTMETQALFGEVLDELQEAADSLLDTARVAVSDAEEAFEIAKAGLQAEWQNRRCNRSANSGQARAALALERSDPHTSVTLVHLSCSGATIHEGLIGPYEGQEPPANDTLLPPQVDRAEALIGGREVDALLLSIGVNDVGFGDLINACVLQEPCTDWDARLDAQVRPRIEALCALVSVFDADCITHYQRMLDRYADPVLPDSAATIFENGAAGLPASYRDLAVALAEAFPAIAAEPDRVYINEYPNALEDDDRSVCSFEDDGPFGMLPGISATEGAWLRDHVTRNLNGMVADAAEAHGWTLIDGIFAAFAGHGYCADDAWVRRLQDSFRMQAQEFGTAHPTSAGHGTIRAQYLAALKAEMYRLDETTGLPDLTRPRAPVDAYAPGLDTSPPVVTGLPDRAANGAGWYNASVTIDWQAADPAPSSGTPTDPANTVAATDGADVVYTSDPSCDPVDRCATGSLALSIDTAPPTVACTLPAPVFTLGAAGATVSATVADTLSGPQTTAVSGAADTTTVGLKSLVLTGHDLAGNEGSSSCAYTVAYVFGEFSAPVNGGGVRNVVRAGRAVPLKWRLTDAAGAPVTGLSTAIVTVAGLACPAGATTDLIEESYSGGSGLQDLGDGYYQLNWKTPTSYAGSCKTMRLDLGEGLVHTALFEFTQ